MEVLYLLIPLSLVFITIAVYVIYLAIKSDQFDDMEGPAHRILMDDQSQRRYDLAAREALKAKTPAALKKTTSPSDVPKDVHHD
jgi:cbb3-type cytochrome oxidase maturation protein